MQKKLQLAKGYAYAPKMKSDSLSTIAFHSALSTMYSALPKSRDCAPAMNRSRNHHPL